MGDQDQFAAFDRGFTKVRDKPTYFKLKDLTEGHNNVHVIANVLGVGPTHDCNQVRNKVPVKGKAFPLLIGDDTAVANAKVWFVAPHAEMLSLKGRTVIFHGFKTKAMDDQGKALRTSIGTVGLDANEGTFTYEVLPKGDFRGANFPNGREKKVPEEWLYLGSSTIPFASTSVDTWLEPCHQADSR